MLGVSPSFFFSKYSTNFSIFDYIDGLDYLEKLGVDCFQGEIYKKEKINEWELNAKKLVKAYKEKDLIMSLFVAHFFIHYTENFDSLFDDSYLENMKRVCEIVKNNFHEVDTIVIPIGKYSVNDIHEDYKKIRNRFIFVIERIANLLKGYGFNLALEIIPGSLVGGIDGLIRIIEETGCDNLGYNLDTGHAYCSGEILSLLPSKLKGKIFGTHIKDNFGDENLALAPGLGNIDFEKLLKSLTLNGYKRSLDLEISSDCENVIKDYSIGVSYLNRI